MQNKSLVETVDNESDIMLLFQCYTNVAPLLQPHRTGDKLMISACMASLSLLGGASKCTQLLKQVENKSK